MELLSLMAVMSEGLGFNLCVAPFLNVCVLNLLQRVGDGGCWRWLELGQRWLELGRRWLELGRRCCTRVEWGETELDCSENKG